MKSARILVMLILMAMIISACGNVPTKQPTLVPTATAYPTYTPQPTYTPYPTTVPTTVPTVAPSITPTPDLRIVDTDPQMFILKQVDFPKAGLYYLPNETWIGKDTNDQIIVEWGVNKGQDYVTNTGRIGGWWDAYNRGTLAVKMPKELSCDVILC